MTTAGGLVELEGDADGGIEVEQVGVRQFLALKNLRGAEPGGLGEPAPAHDVPRGFLVGVLAVAQIAHRQQRELQRGVLRKRHPDRPQESPLLRRRPPRAPSQSSRRRPRLCSNALRISSKRNSVVGVPSIWRSSRG
jgi:hypothetical protein